LIEGLADRGFAVAPELAQRIKKALGSTPLSHFWSELEDQVAACDEKKKPFLKSYLLTTARDAAGSWPRADKAREKERSAGRKPGDKLKGESDFARRMRLKYGGRDA
jgi:hypothetical protein